MYSTASATCGCDGRRSLPLWPSSGWQRQEVAVSVSVVAVVAAEAAVVAVVAAEAAVVVVAAAVVVAARGACAK